MTDSSFKATTANGKPLRVFFMADHLGHPDGRVHGGTTYFLNTLPALHRAGVQLTVCFMQPRHPMAEKLEVAGVNPHFLGLRKHSPRSLTAFIPLLELSGADVVHLHSFKSHYAGLRAAHARGIASIVHVHDHITIPQPLGWLIRRHGPKVGAIVAITESVRNFASREYNVPPDRCHTVLLGFDPAPFMSPPADARQNVRRELNLSPDEPVIAVIGRVISDKGQDQLIRAMPRILAGLPATKLLIVGDGPDRQEYEALARELNLAHAIRFIGQRPDIPSVHQAIDLMVMPSMWEEGFGLTALEAMLSYRPVVAFNTGGIPTIVRDGETGLLVPRADQTALADAVLTLLRDEPLRRKMGKQGCEHALGFSMDKHVANMLRIYRGVIEANRK